MCKEEDVWPLTPLGDFCRRVVRRAGDGLYDVLSLTKDRGLILQSERFSKRLASRETSGYLVIRKGEFAYDPMLLWSGALACLDRHDEGVISPAYEVFQVDRARIDPGFLKALFRAPRMVERFRALSQGTNVRRKQLEFDTFGSIRVRLPSLARQVAIGRALSIAEQAIASAHRLCEELNVAKRVTMRELLTLGTARDPSRLRPLSSRWIMGRIAEGVTAGPEGWRLVQLTAVAKLESGHTPSREHPEWWSGNIPWLSLADTDALDSLNITETAERVTPEGIINSSARILPAGTVVLSRTATVGKATILGVAMATSQDFANWVCGPELEPRYLLQVFRHMSREWERLQEGSTHQTIYMPVFKRLQIFLPPKEEQVRIADIGEAFDCRIDAESALLRERINSRDALAGELLSGRLRLPPAVITRHNGPDPDARAA